MRISRSISTVAALLITIMGGTDSVAADSVTNSPLESEQLGSLGTFRLSAKSAWYPEVETLLDVDRHGTYPDAARDLVRRWLGESDRFDAKLLDKPEPPDKPESAAEHKISVWLDESLQSSGALATIAREIRNRKPNWLVVLGDDPVATHDDSAAMGDDLATANSTRLELTLISNPHADDQLRMIARDGETVTFEHAVQVRHKPWLLDLPAIQTGEDGTIRAVVRGLASSQPEQLDATVVRTLIDDVLIPNSAEFAALVGRNETGPGKSDRSETLRGGDREWLESRIGQLLQSPSSGLVLDRLAQSFSTSVGDVSETVVRREAILCEFPPEKIDQLVARLNVELADRKAMGRRRVVLLGVGSLAGLCVLGLAHRMIDHATQGYFAWALNSGTFLLAGLGLLLVIRIASFIL